MLGYTAALQLAGGLPTLFFHFFYEAPLLLGLYFLLNSLLRPSRWSAWVAALPIVMAYTAYDAFFVAYGAVFRIVDLNELPALVAVLPTSYKIGFSALIALPLILFFKFADFKKYKTAFAGVTSFFALGAATQFSPQPIVSVFENIGDGISPWAEASSVRNKGRFSMVVYLEAKRKQTKNETAAHHDRPRYVQDMIKAADEFRGQVNGRNVHVILLESFLDPTLMKNVRFSKAPHHPDYARKYSGGLGLSVAPVFGGNTAQSEFEVLCGVPAFRKISNIEFNAFGGAPTYCLPGFLAQAGYQTVASNGFRPNFFNTLKAYRGIGFAEAYFPTEYAKQRPSYFSTGFIAPGEIYMFDGNLFDANLQFVRQRIKERPGQPLLNYVSTIYGHFPHYMDPVKRPQVLTMEAAFNDAQLLRSANQYFYRTEAIARYLDGLIETDPDSLIILFGDHLPPLQEGIHSYRKFKYLDNVEESGFINRILVIENGKPAKYPTIHHYDIPSLIYNYLTGGKFCTEHACNLRRTLRPREEYENAYLRLMTHAVDVNE